MPSICEARKDALFYGCHKSGRVAVIIGVAIGSDCHPGRNRGTHFHIVDKQRHGTADSWLVAEGYVYCLPRVWGQADTALCHIVPTRQRIGVAIEFHIGTGVGAVSIGANHNAIDAWLACSRRQSYSPEKAHCQCCVGWDGDSLGDKPCIRSCIIVTALRTCNPISIIARTTIITHPPNVCDVLCQIPTA